MIPDTGTLTAVLKDFLAVFKLGQAAVSKDATSLLSILAAIELTLAGLGWAYSGSEVLHSLFRKILLIFFFIFIIDNYDSLVHTVIAGFIYTGKTASTGSTDVFASFEDPSSIIEVGFKTTEPIIAHLQSLPLFPPPLFDLVIDLIALLLLLAAFFIISIQVFVTYLEFAMISTLALIFIPFGVFRHTSFLAEKTFGAVIAFGVKLMVLGLIVSIAMPLLKQFTLSADSSPAQLFQMLVVCLAIAGLSWHAPGIAAGLLTGGPTLAVHSALQTAGAAGAGVMAGAAAAGALTSGAAATARGASYGLGKISGNLQVQNANQSIKSNGSGGGDSSPPATAAAATLSTARQRGLPARVATAFGAAALQSAEKRTIRPIKESFERGRESVPGYIALRSEREAAVAVNKNNATEKAGELHSDKVIPLVKTNGTPPQPASASNNSAQMNGPLLSEEDKPR